MVAHCSKSYTLTIDVQIFGSCSHVIQLLVSGAPDIEPYTQHREISTIVPDTLRGEGV